MKNVWRKGSEAKNNYKKCSSCQIIKKTEEFRKSKIFSDGFYCQCRSCLRKKSRKYIYKTRKIDEKIYNDLLEKQNYKCAICKISFLSINSKKIHIDHCHKLDKVRGLLCNKCNFGIGLLGDCSEGVFMAVTYLRSVNA